ncbi:hypothetical protein [Paenibacillus terrae]|uniref:Uncharacterized protein n=1 Tax=Paenibacillus terrae TaxID=159743 RepID=A0A0D7WTZ5_9BACL|nr:hypothetical protein [Paenibacillus terrae]KJD42651.1 hypothetical protein QD47_26950 [Paenibacillus terrae]
MKPIQFYKTQKWEPLFIHYFYKHNNKKIRAILSKSAKNPGCYQVTTFTFSSRTDMFIPWSDYIRDSLRACLRQLNTEGYTRELQKRFDLFENPENFVPTPIRDMNLKQRQEERMARFFGLDILK